MASDSEVTLTREPRCAREGDRMTWSSRMVVVALLPVVAFAEGCAGGATVTSALLCENTGGKYANRTCMPGSPRRAADMCAGFGGSYSEKEDECKIPPRTP